MGFEITWYEKDRIINARAVGNLSLEDIDNANKTIIEHVNLGIAPVHLFIDVAAVGKVPTNLNQMKKSMELLNHPSMGWAVLVGSNPVARFLASVISQVMKIRFTIVTNQEEALTFLTRQDITLVTIKRE